MDLCTILCYTLNIYYTINKAVGQEQMKQVKKPRIFKLIISLICYAAVICAAILAIPAIFSSASGQDATGEVVYEGIELSEPLFCSAPGYQVAENKYASIDYSNISQGYVAARYKGGASDEPILKVRFGESEHVYVLGGEDIVPLTFGDGTYEFRVFQKVKGGKYRAVMTKKLSVELDNQLLPYLHPSHMVDYSASSGAVLYSSEITYGLDSDLDKLSVIYDFIIENIVYDFPKAASVEPGYIPSVDSTFISRSGICFDYSVMLAAMLRTQMIPTKLVTGYLHGTSIFHAWNEVYLKDSGWVTVHIFVDESTFRMLDTTIAASQGDEEIAQKLDDPEVYMAVFWY